MPKREEIWELKSFGQGKARLCCLDCESIAVKHREDVRTLLTIQYLSRIDSHAHVLQYGESESAVSLVGASSVVEVRERIANYIESSPLHKYNTSQFILGLGWDQTKFTDTNGNFPTAVSFRQYPNNLALRDLTSAWMEDYPLAGLGFRPEIARSPDLPQAE